MESLLPQHPTQRRGHMNASCAIRRPRARSTDQLDHSVLSVKPIRTYSQMKKYSSRYLCACSRARERSLSCVFACVRACKRVRATHLVRNRKIPRIMKLEGVSPGWHRAETKTPWRARYSLLVCVGSVTYRRMYVKQASRRSKSKARQARILTQRKRVHPAMP